MTELKEEIECQKVSQAEIDQMEFMLGGTVDLDDGEKALPAF